MSGASSPRRTAPPASPADTPPPPAADWVAAGAGSRSRAGALPPFNPTEPATWPPVSILTDHQLLQIANVVVTKAFDPKDVDTWPPTMTAYHVAAIYQRTPGGVRKAAQHHRFIPAPFKARPWRWRKVDVERDVIGARGGFKKARAA